MQVALDLLGVADGVREVVARQHQAEAGQQAEQQADARPAAASAAGSGICGGLARSTTLTLLVRIEAAMSVSLSFCSSTSYRLLAESASFLQRLQLGRLAALVGGLRLLGVDRRAQLRLALAGAARTRPRGRRGSAARAPACAFLSCSTWAFTFWTSGWPSLNFSPSRPSSTARPASWVLKPITTESEADLRQRVEVLARLCISAACLSAASIVIRRACACTKSSLSLAIEVETAETLPSGTNRSWLR